MSEIPGKKVNATFAVSLLTLIATLATFFLVATGGGGGGGGGKPRGAASFRRIRLFNGSTKPVRAHVTVNTYDNAGARVYYSKEQTDTMAGDPFPNKADDVRSGYWWTETEGSGSPLYAQAELISVELTYDAGGANTVYTLPFLDPDSTNVTDLYTELAIFVLPSGTVHAIAWHAQGDQMKPRPVFVDKP